MKKRTPYRLTAKQKRYLAIKRGLDKAASLVALVVLSPLIGGITLAIRKEDGKDAPVMFTQDRIGIDGTHFQMYKFRTMKVDTPHDIPTHLMKNPEQFITKTGKTLRKYSLDELPQLVNIFKGDMSFIGPRPALYNQDDLIAAREVAGVHQVPPGLTGFAQCHGRDELPIPEKVRMDAIYLRRIGFKMDTSCFFHSIRSVATGEGIVEGALENASEVDMDNPVVPRKVMIITNHSYMLYRFRKELIKAFIEHGDEVVISTPFVGHVEDLKALGAQCIEAPVDRRGTDPKKDLELMRVYRRQLQAVSPDAVLTYSIKPNIYAGIQCKKMQIPYYAQVQGLGTAFQCAGTARLVTILYRKGLKKARQVFFENQENAEEFIRRRIIPKEKITVLNGAGVNLDEYPYVPIRREDDADQTTHFLYLGRIMKEKGCSELLAATKRLHEEGADILLDLVGFFEDDYEEQIQKAQEDGYVCFHGFQEDPQPYYADADCIVMPSWHEGMSNVNLEAAATGRPVITTNIPGCREAVEDGRTGILCAHKDEDSLYEAMKRFLALNNEERAEMGEAARKKMETEFAKEHVVSKTIDAMGA